MSLLINLRGNMNLVLSILIYFIPLTIITGPFIPDLLTSLSALLFIIISNFENRIWYVRSISVENAIWAVITKIYL